MDFRTTIDRRRAGVVHSKEEIEALVRGATDGSVPDYQLSAWLMAAVMRPLSDGETTDLTLAMARSGQILDLAALPRPHVDKHSTGGVGDKTTLVLLPLLAACGLTMVKMSGRGLGITGGTIDKLESIPGMRTDLGPDELIAQGAKIGIALSGQSPTLAPADGALYALRDATGTVDSIPLIVSSILSKKIAGGAETVVLDVKCGSGAFMRDRAQADLLAAALRSVGERAGLRVGWAITDMNVPLGAACGNALEVAEARAVLRGDPLSPAVERFRTLCLELADLALDKAGVPRTALERLEDGSAWAKAQAWISAQGGDWTNWEPIAAPFVVPMAAAREGVVTRLDAGEVGGAVVALGGGRLKKSDAIDGRVGVVVHRTVGERVAAGEPILSVHAASEDAARAALASIRPEIGDGPESMPPAMLAQG